MEVAREAVQYINIVDAVELRVQAAGAGRAQLSRVAIDTI